LVVAVLLAIAVRASACDAPPDVRPPAVVSDGSGILVAWEQADRDGATTYVRRFATMPDGNTVVRAGTAVHRERYGTSWYSPELVAGPAGSLVIVAPKAGEQAAIPLDRDGAPAGPPRPLTECARRDSSFSCFDLCRGPVATRGGFAVGHVLIDPRTSVSGIAVSFLDARGETVRAVHLPAAWPGRSCATAALGDEVVVAYGDTQVDRTQGVRIYFLSGHQLWLPDAGVPRRLVAEGAQLYLLYADATGVAHVASLDRDAIRTTTRLPADVDWRTADLGITDRGVYVTWLAGGVLRVRAVYERDAGARSRRVAASAVGTRTLGVADRCITAWTSAGGAKLHVLATEQCP
jgi:hypothetical protein